MNLRLGIDIGTSGVRSAVLAPDGKVIAEARTPHLPQTGADIDAELWWQGVAACISAQIAALSKLGRSGQEISGIAIDGTSGSMVLTDAALRPISPALMYNSKGFDPEAKRIAAHAPEGHIAQGSNSALARAMCLVALAEEKPAHLLHQADFILARLAGTGGHSDVNNALKTGVDPETGRWHRWIETLIAPELLPRSHAVGTAITRIDPACAAELGLSPEATLHAGTTDSIAAFLAAAPLEPGVAVTSLGSTLAVKFLGTQRIDDPAIGLYSHKVGDVWLTGGASNTGGAVLAAHFSPEALVALSLGLEHRPDTGLDYYPLLKPGERFPVNDPALAPRLAPRPHEDRTFLRGLFEAIARIESACYRAIEARGGGTPAVIYSAGGGAQNPALTAIRARALDVPLREAAQSDACFGAASLIEAPVPTV